MKFNQAAPTASNRLKIMASRGIRNCNPGNIRRSNTTYKGEIRPSQDKAFKQFQTMAYGYRAMFVLLDYYRRVHGLNTIRQIITRYAPANENNTEGYIRIVASLSGISEGAVLDTRNHDQMVPIVSAMSRVENGTRAVASQVEEGWSLFKSK